MNTSQNFLIDVLLVAIGLHFTIYLVYGRITHKPLVGNYKPGVPGYDIFRKITTNNKYLAISSAVTLFLIVNLIFDTRAVLRSHLPHSILAVAPISIAVALFLAFKALPIVFKKQD